MRNPTNIFDVQLLEIRQILSRGFIKMLFKFALLAFLCVAAASVRPRKQAPLFKAKAVLNDKFIDVSLKSYADEGKWTVLLFYPFDYTFVCPVSSSLLLMNVLMALSD